MHKLLQYISVFVVITVPALVTAQIDEINILPNNGASNDVFGSAVDISGDFLVSGAPLKNNGNQSNTGEVYIYEKSGADWNLMTSITASDREADDRFGTSVAIDGNRVVVGAPFDDDIANSTGAVYIFEYDGTNWNEITKLTDPALQANDEFGHDVSINGDWIAIGVPKDDDLNANSGAVWMYEFDGTNWTYHSTLTSAFTEFGEELFGYSVSVNGARLAVGSPLDDDAATDAGNAFIYDYDGTNWNFTEKLVPSDGGNSFSFGFDLELDQDQVIVGAYGGNPNLLSAGAAYIYQFDGSNWNEQQIIFSNDATADDWFGYKVGIDGETAIMSAINDDDNGTSSGSVYVYRWDQTEWIQEFKVISNDGNNGDEYGNAIAIDDLDFIVGAYKRDISGSNSGKGYAYSLCSYKPEFDLCMATVDSTSQGHWLLFETPRATLVDSFYVYADYGAGFQRIEGLEYGETPQVYNGGIDFINDTIQYYLASINVCGIESDLSVINKPMYTHAKFVSNETKVLVEWTPYEGYDFTYYRIWRDNNGSGNWTLIGSQLDYITEFVDQTPPANTQNVLYRVEAFGGMNCTLSRGYVNALSNAFNPNNAVEPPSGLTENDHDDLALYPNPAQTHIAVENLNQELRYTITDLSGRVVLQGTTMNKQRINVAHLSKGNYILQGTGVETRDQIVFKFVVQ